jgi:hypothetical protein
MVKVLPFILFEREPLNLQQIGWEPIGIAAAKDAFFIATKTGKLKQ